VQQLNTALSKSNTRTVPTLSDADRALLRTEFRLSDEEFAEIDRPTFTALDAHHLDLCFLLHDAVVALNLGDQPDRDRALAAFAWVARQVRFSESAGEPAPPEYVLRRGWGSAHERALVFLALLDQLNIPGCMIALPDARAWLPGALVGKDILLFETRLGLPLPGPDGLPANFAQLRLDPAFLQKLSVDKEHPYDVTPEQARGAELQVSCPLCALAPRMGFLEQLLAPGIKARLTVSPAGRLQAFRAAVPKDCAVRAWDALDSSLRVLRAFLPAEQGGSDRSPIPRLARFQMSLTPWSGLPEPARSSKENVDPAAQVRSWFAQPFMEFALSPDKPRDLVLRGRWEDAVKTLVAMLEDVQQQREALLNDAEAGRAFVQWYEEARRSQAALLQASSSKAPDAPATLEAAQGRLQSLMRDPRIVRKPLKLLMGTAAGSLGAEATYQMALCKHELAEQSRSSEAWKDVAGRWQRYLDEYPGGAGEATARCLGARAWEKAGDMTAARDLLANPPARLGPWDRLALRVRLLQLKTPD
jgi:hypothetical protein